MISSLRISVFILLALSHTALLNDETLKNFEDKEEINLFKDEPISSRLISWKDLSSGYVNLTKNISGTFSANETKIFNSTIRVTCSMKGTLFPSPVEIVNSTRLAAILQRDPNITSKNTPANCVVVLFYSPTCPFSCRAAPHFNELPRYFSDVQMVAIDAMTHRTFNAQYGIYGVPTMILFHNGKAVARLNETFYNLKLFVRFIWIHTNLVPSDRELKLFSNAFKGPVPSLLVNEKDYYLVLSWIVIILQLLYAFFKSSWGRWLVDATRNAWQEAEAQHHHID